MKEKPQSQVLLYRAPDGRTRLEVRMQDETVWLTQAQMAELFQTTQQNVSLHIRNIYEEGELTPEATHKESLSVRPQDGGVRAEERGRKRLSDETRGAGRLKQCLTASNRELTLVASGMSRLASRLGAFSLEPSRFSFRG